MKKQQAFAVLELWRVSTRTMAGTITATVGIALFVVIPGDRGADPLKALTVDEVIRLWKPELKGSTDYGQMGGSPEQVPKVAAYSFRVVGPTLEELWNHYAELCGMKKRYTEKMLQVTADTGPNGNYVVSDRASGDGHGGRGPSVFLLKTDSYTVTITFQQDAGSKSISGSLTAVVP